MKKIILIAIVSIVFASCGTQENVSNTNKWIKSHERPISCEASYIRPLDGAKGYSLIDANGEIYDTGLLSINLPDTIH